MRERERERERVRDRDRESKRERERVREIHREVIGRKIDLELKMLKDETVGRQKICQLQRTTKIYCFSA